MTVTHTMDNASARLGGVALIAWCPSATRWQMVMNEGFERTGRNANVRMGGVELTATVCSLLSIQHSIPILRCKISLPNERCMHRISSSWRGARR